MALKAEKVETVKLEKDQNLLAMEPMVRMAGMLVLAALVDQYYYLFIPMLNIYYPKFLLRNKVDIQEQMESAGWAESQAKR